MAIIGDAALAAPGGGAISVAGADIGALDAIPNCCRIRFVTYSEESNPQAGQTNCTGCPACSEGTSKAYLAPHAHWIFKAEKVHGLSSTTPGGCKSENGTRGGDHSTRPSVNRKLPPCAS